MAGTFTVGEVPTRPGSYYRRTSVGVNVESSTNGILAVLYQSDWGSLGEVFDIDATMLNNLEDYCGSGAQIIREGLIGGATTVRSIRVGSDNGECSKVILKSAEVERIEDGEESVLVSGTNPVTFSVQNLVVDSVTVTAGDDELELDTDYTVNSSGVTILGKEGGRGSCTISYQKKIISPSVDSVELQAKFPGTKSFTASLRTNLITDKRQLIIYSGTSIFTSVSFDQGSDEAQNLVDALATNRFFTARKIFAAPLADVVQVPLTGGVNPTVTAADYSRGTDALERYSWNVVVADSDSSAISGILNAFVAQGYQTGHLGMCVVAGKSSQSLEDRMDYARSCNDEKTVYVLNGWIGNDGTVYEGYMAAARIGAMIAACPTNQSLTHTAIKNALRLIEPLTNGEITRAEEHGCLVLSLNAEDSVVIDSAINTLVTLGADMDSGWRKVRRTKTRFSLMDRINRTFDKICGKITNDRNGQATLLAAAQRCINDLISSGCLVDGSYAEIDPANPPIGDRVYLLLHILDYDSAEKIFSTFVFQYSQSFDE